MGRHKLRDPLYRQASLAEDEETVPRVSPRLQVIPDQRGDVISYANPNLCVAEKRRLRRLGRLPGEGLEEEDYEEEEVEEDDEEGLDYEGPRGEKLATYVAAKPAVSTPYFEIGISERSAVSDETGVYLGLVPRTHPLKAAPGWAPYSIGLHTGTGLIYKGRGSKSPSSRGPKCKIGDRVGCGVRFVTPPVAGDQQAVAAKPGTSAVYVQIFFTHNGREVKTVETLMGRGITFPWPPGGLFPAVSLEYPEDEIVLINKAHFYFTKFSGVGGSLTSVGLNEDEMAMVVDGGEEDWPRLHDIKLVNGNVLEYVGKGKSLQDVGLAQSKNAINTRNHYFEIEIVDPGVSCYIAIGLARKDYPRNRHPGWNKGSIAYHADDGKLFVGSGVGVTFGPRCQKGDVMGCGVLFPRNYEPKSDSEEELAQQAGLLEAADRAAIPPLGAAGPISANFANLSREERNREAAERSRAQINGLEYGDNWKDMDPDIQEELEERRFKEYFERKNWAARFPPVRRLAELGPGRGHPLGIPPEEDDLSSLIEDYDESDSENELEWWEGGRGNDPMGVKVEIYFTKNGKMIGKHDVRIPKGGFYPTIGMMSCQEKVRVDLRPLSG